MIWSWADDSCAETPEWVHFRLIVGIKDDSLGLVETPFLIPEKCKHCCKLTNGLWQLFQVRTLFVCCLGLPWPGLDHNPHLIISIWLFFPAHLLKELYPYNDEQGKKDILRCGATCVECPLQRCSTWCQFHSLFAARYRLFNICPNISACCELFLGFFYSALVMACCYWFSAPTFVVFVFIILIVWCPVSAEGCMK